MTGGDIKAVQGDSGHSQVDMITEVYAHIFDESRIKNAEIFEEQFYADRKVEEKPIEKAKGYNKVYDGRRVNSKKAV